MKISRIQILAILAITLTGLSSCGSPQESAELRSARLNSLMETFFEEQVALSPMRQTQLGRPTNKDKWDDLSEDAEVARLLLNRDQLQRLQAMGGDNLDASATLSYRMMERQLQRDIDDFQWRLYNYPVNQMFGAHTGAITLLLNNHRVESAADMDAYIARLNALPPYLAQLQEALQRRAEAGIIAPRFVFPHVVRDSRNIISGQPFDDTDRPSALLADIDKKLAALQERGAISAPRAAQYRQRALEALMQSVRPAYQRLVAYMQTLAQSADSRDGVWKLPRGDEFYRAALARTTTTDLGAAEIHDIGLAEVARIHGEMDAIRVQVGFAGDLAAFMEHMRTDQSFFYPNDDSGRQRYLDESVALIDAMEQRTSELFNIKPRAALEVRAVEPFREQSAGKAFYNRPSEDGTRPGIYYVNLYDMNAMPVNQMEALAYHEGTPGHHMQLAIAQELQGVPSFRKFGRVTAYTEGWGLYSEYLPREYGFYSDPYSDFGRLAMELWRACRLVVDTGIHSMKWTRETSIDYYMQNTPNPRSDAVKMVERHIVMPSQATAYKIGMMKILQLRERARDRLGERFDIRDFHDVVLRQGAVPLDILEQNVEEWLAAEGV